MHLECKETMDHQNLFFFEVNETKIDYNSSGEQMEVHVGNITENLLLMKMETNT